MTEQTQPSKVAKLTPEEWKTLCVLSAHQLQTFLQGVPGHVESGASGLSDAHMALIDAHIDRARQFMRAWSLARMDVSAQQAAPAPQAQPEAAQVNGAGPTKRKGGWPRGKKRAPKAQQEAGQ